MQAIAVTSVYPTSIPPLSIFPEPAQSKFAGASAASEGNRFAEKSEDHGDEQTHDAEHEA